MDLLKRALPDYLKHRFGPAAELIKSNRFPRGSSRVTWFVDYRPALNAPVSSVVFRGDLAWRQHNPHLAGAGVLHVRAQIEEAHQLLRDYIKWQMQREAQLIEPAFVGYGARR